jgi:chorismate mutase
MSPERPPVVRALRGATTLDLDTPEQMHERMAELARALFAANDIDADDVVSVFVTATPDVSSMFPAAALRAWGLDDVALMGAQELDVRGAPARCLRVMIHVYTRRSRAELVPVYLHDARRLRPDLATDAQEAP